ncbi:3-isopropylmalate dehydratase small subunit [Methanocaldococcus villosus KIN24-T80]|uniref:3-isopropylmalate dehydratase small subunit n=1 Tax=Methanocaldococcus villosus KIN24-T80 TaxID=1069083 RepID=N6UZZ5_9EURY|nr:3-isopropylmalate dehydratase small subunit [Methanocaldococcus villosus]ENN95603.1 3-isopropylmalate dehydratase small subunit [Methanocaldococcus villosus KIN24-T80]
MIRGRVWKFGDNVDTDAIMPARYLVYTEPEELAKYVMTGIDEDFPKKVKKGDIIVAGKNFGCGSSREHAPLGLKGAGISCIIAKSFARIFYRNAINLGLPLIECKDVDKINEGDILEVDLKSGVIRNVTTGEVLYGNKLPDFMMEILEAGGLMNYLKKRLANEKSY